MMKRVAAARALIGCLATAACSSASRPDLVGVIVTVTPPVTQPGYERSCAQGEGCVFGPAWSDDVTVRCGHNGCDTRNDMLNQSLDGKTHRAGTHECVVLSGTFRDPYSGAQVDFVKERAYEVQVDHVFPLAVAWDRGAAQWSLERRRDFANDPDNLVVTTRSVNQNKRARTPSSWLPTDAAGRCQYLRTFITVVRTYQLPISTAEAKVASEGLAACSPTGVSV